MSKPAFRYRAFISYSSQDKSQAERLHRALEAYRVPSGVDADLKPDRRLGRFFRDDDEIGATADIGDSVRAAIRDAESLVVLCSPAAARSAWVDAEILHFRRTGRGDRVFAIIIDGIPNSGDPATECFPPSLRSRDRHPSSGRMPMEPLGLYFRREPFSRLQTRLVAGLLGIEFDSLWRREQRRQSRRRLAAAGLILLGVALAVAAILQYRLAREEQRRNIALQRESVIEELREIAGRSTFLANLAADQDDPAVAALLALEAWNFSDPRADASALHRALAADGPQERMQVLASAGWGRGLENPPHPHASAELRRNVGHLREVGFLRYRRDYFTVGMSPAGDAVALGYENGLYVVVRIADAHRLAQGYHREYIQYLFFGAAGDLLVAVSDEKIEAVALSDGEVVYQLATRPVRMAALSPDRARIAVVYEQGDVAVLDLATGQPSGTVPALPGAASEAAWAPGGHLLMTVADTLFRVDGNDLEAPDGRKVAFKHRIDQLVTQPGSAALAVFDQRGGITVFSGRADRDILRLTQDDPISGADAVLRDDVDRLYIQEREGIAVWNLANSERTKIATCDAAVAESLTTSASHRYLAAGTREGVICVWNASDLSLVWRHDPKSSVIDWLRFSADEKHLVTAHRDGSLRTWLLDEATAFTERPSCEGDLIAVGFDRAGEYLYGRAGVMGVCRWRVGDSEFVEHFPGYRMSRALLPFHVDGDRLIVTDRSGRLVELDGSRLEKSKEYRGSDAIFSDGGYSIDSGGVVGFDIDGFVWVWPPGGSDTPVRLDKTFSGDAVRVFSVAEDMSMVCVVDPSSGGYVLSGTTGEVLAHFDVEEKVIGVEFRMMDETVVVTLEEGTTYRYSFDLVKSAPGRITELDRERRFDLPASDLPPALVAVESTNRLGIRDIASNRALLVIEKDVVTACQVYGAVLAASGRHLGAVAGGPGCPGGPKAIVWAVPEIIARRLHPRSSADVLTALKEGTWEDFYHLLDFWVAESEHWAFAAGSKALHRCLSPADRARFHLGPDPPCWCVHKSFPTLEQWRDALGYDPFSAQRSDGSTCTDTELKPWQEESEHG